MIQLAPPSVTTPDAIAARLQGFETWTVAVGALVLAVQVDPTRAQALVTATLEGQPVLRRLVTITAPNLVVDVAANGAVAKGSVGLALATPPQYSSLVADLRVAKGAEPASLFRGDLVTWIAAADPVLIEFDRPISADLAAHTSVLGLDGATAEMAFVSGSVILESATVMQLSPTATFGRILVGAVEIAAGATITLTIPSQDQPGMLVLQARFPRLAPGSQDFAGAVATWPLP